MLSDKSFLYGLLKWKQWALQENFPYFQVSNSAYLLMNQVSPGAEEALSVRSEWVISLGSQGFSYHWLIVESSSS